jgi:hypothetical protein
LLDVYHIAIALFCTGWPSEDAGCTLQPLLAIFGIEKQFGNDDFNNTLINVEKDTAVTTLKMRCHAIGHRNY